jgi:hypothetical protein
MPTLCTAAALAVAVAYCVWRAWALARLRREALLHRRVAYLLWVVAGADDEADAPPHARGPHTVNYEYE